MKKWSTYILLLLGFILSVYLTYWVWTPSYKEYIKEKRVEFTCLKKHYSAPAYRTYESFNMICLKDGIKYYIEVEPITYYDTKEGDKVTFILSQKDLDRYLGKERNLLDMFKPFLLILLFITTTIFIIICIEEKMSKGLLTLSCINTGYIITTVVYYTLINLHLCN